MTPEWNFKQAAQLDEKTMDDDEDWGRACDQLIQHIREPDMEEHRDQHGDLR